MANWVSGSCDWSHMTAHAHRDELVMHTANSSNFSGQRLVAYKNSKPFLVFSLRFTLIFLKININN